MSDQQIQRNFFSFESQTVRCFFSPTLRDSSKNGGVLGAMGIPVAGGHRETRGQAPFHEPQQVGFVLQECIDQQHVKESNSGYWWPSSVK